MDSRVRGLQIVIGRNSGFLIVLHSSRLQIHAFDVGRAADADQDLVDDHGEFVIVADQIDELLISFCTHIAASVLRWMPIPSRARASERICAASRSSLPRNIGSFCTMLTCEPNRQKACANSHPSGPPPRTSRRRGHSVRSKTLSLVR